MKQRFIVGALALLVIHTTDRPSVHVAPLPSVARISGHESGKAVATDLERGLSPAAPGASRPDAAQKVRLAAAYAKLPLGFEANRGQTDAHVQFVSRGAGYTLFLTSTEAVLALRKASPETNERTLTTPLRMKLIGSNPAPRVSQDDELPGKSNYIIGSDRRNWHTEIPRYGKVKYQDVYPGVDLVYYGNQQQLEYDFIVAPGADPDVIELAFEGAQDVHVDDGGDLLLATGDSEIRLKTRRSSIRRPTGAACRFRAATGKRAAIGLRFIWVRTIPRNRWLSIQSLFTRRISGGAVRISRWESPPTIRASLTSPATQAPSTFPRRVRDSPRAPRTSVRAISTARTLSSRSSARTQPI